MVMVLGVFQMLYYIVFIIREWKYVIILHNTFSTLSQVPPPWLIAQQRYGPPPSYPNLKIAGLNAPIPDGCAFGYHAGGWGKPPVDEHGKPLYGDVFGHTQNAQDVSGLFYGNFKKTYKNHVE